jgi:hypothetical protein
MVKITNWEKQVSGKFIKWEHKLNGEYTNHSISISPFIWDKTNKWQLSIFNHKKHPVPFSKFSATRKPLYDYAIQYMKQNP